MQLGHELIKKCVKAYRGDDEIPWDQLVVGSNSVDVTLSDKFVRTRARGADGCVDPYDADSLAADSCTAEAYILAPGEGLLGCTRERFVVQQDQVALYGCIGQADMSVAPMYDGRSTCGRLFLASHITAGYGDVGFQSAWTLELKNHANYSIKLRAGMRIGQVSFHYIHGCGGTVYNGSYNTQHYGPRPPALGKERF